MAIVACKECGKDVSDKAKKCLACGIQLRKPKRGIFGSLYMASFILFNVFMVFSLVAGIDSTADLQTANEAEEAGKMIGATLGIGMLMVFWVMGDIILGILVLLTRPK